MMGTKGQAGDIPREEWTEPSGQIRYRGREGGSTKELIYQDRPK